MTHPEDTTATIERDLLAVDAALASGAAAADDPVARELQELALALRAEGVEPAADFTSELRARVEAGFPPEPGSPRALLLDSRGRLRGAARRLPSPVRLLPAAAALTTVVLIGLALSSVDIARNSGDDDGGGASLEVQEDSGGGEGGGAAEPTLEADRRARDAGGAVVPSPPAVPGEPPTGRGFAPGRRQRRIERSISMTLAAADDEIPEVADGVTEVTNRHGGFVLRSNLSSDDEGAGGSFELRIPSVRLREALADLAGLATVRSQSQSGQDVTREHVTTRDRLQSARAERRSLLRRLEVAETDEEAESIRRSLDLVAGEINGLRAQLRDLRLRTDYAVVTVDLEGESADSGSGGAGGPFGDALDDAGDLLVGVAGALIRVSAVVVPLALIGLLAWLVARGVRRRRRESVLA
jgi:hypothetical protein